MNEKYVMTMSREQAEVVKDACELFAWLRKESCPPDIKKIEDGGK